MVKTRFLISYGRKSVQSDENNNDDIKTALQINNKFIFDYYIIQIY